MKENWIHMPHPGHLCVARWCRFHLNTYVNGYIVSTVGEYFPPSDALRTLLRSRNQFPRLVMDENGKLVKRRKLSEEDLEKLLALEGDSFDDAYLSIFGFEELGMNRTYETMVFKAKPEESEEEQCCPWRGEGDCLGMRGYNTPNGATKGHWEWCEKAEMGTFED